MSRGRTALTTSAAIVDPSAPRHKWWSRFVGNWLGTPVVMFISREFRIPGTRWFVEFHKFVNADAPMCYHTHPYTAWRVVLWGGYTEETYNPRKSTPHTTFYHREKVLRKWLPGMIGRVGHEYCHRVHSLFGRVSYSIWIHGPRTHEVRLIGEGWNN